jgi:hypothetical protein
MKTPVIELPAVVTRAEWLAARLKLLTKEKELTHRRDALNAERRRLPMVRIEKDYVFEGPNGKASLLDLFEGRLQVARLGPTRSPEVTSHIYTLAAPPSPSSPARHCLRSSLSRSAWVGPCRGIRHSAATSTLTFT